MDAVAGSSSDAGSAGASGAAGNIGGSGGGGTTVGQDGAAPLAGTSLATFDTGLEGFVFNSYHDLSQTNLADPASGLSVSPTLTFDTAAGSPTAGSLKVTAPYSGANQYVDIQKALGTANLQNWAGKKLHARLRVDAGSTFSGIAQLYVDTTTGYLFGGSASVVAAGSDWQEIVLDLGNPMSFVPGYDPTKVVLFGLQLDTGSAGSGATVAIFHLDSFTLE